MKTNNISKWAALLTVSGLLSIIAPLTVTAQNLVVTTDTTVSGTHYENKATGTAALTNRGTWTFTGSGVTLTGTAASGNGRIGAVVSGGGTVSLTASVINANYYGMNVSGTSTVELNNTNLTTGGRSINLATTSTLAMTGGTITSSDIGVYVASQSKASLRDTVINADGYGVYINTNGGTLTLSGVSITSGSNSGIYATATCAVSVRDTAINSSSHAINVNNSSVTTLSDVSITVGGTSPLVAGRGIQASTGSILTGERLVIQTNNGGNAVHAQTQAQITLSDVDITVSGTTSAGGQNYSGLVASGSGSVLSATNVRMSVSGSNAAGLRLYGSSGATMEVTNLDLVVDGPGAMAVHFTTSSTVGATGVHTLTVSSGTLTAADGRGIAINPQLAYYDMGIYPAEVGGNYDITLRDVLVSASTALEVNTTRSGTQNDGTVSTTEFETNLTMTTERSTLLGDANFLGSSTSAVTLTDSSTLTGNLNGSGSSMTTVILNNSAHTGTTTAGDNAAVTLSGSNGATITGDFIASGSSALTVMLSDSEFTGKSAVSDNAALNVSLTNNSNWKMTGRSRVTTLHGASGGTITIDNVQGEDLIVSGNNGVSGITGETKLNLTLSDGVKGDQEIWVVVDESNKMSGERFTLGNEVSYGMYQYELVNASDGAWLVYTGSSGTNPPVDPNDPDGPDIPPVTPTVPSGPPIISKEGDAIINTAAAVAGFWFTQFDNLHKRMGELRYNKPAGGDLINNVWVRAYGQQINANTGIYSVKGFSEIQYGVDLGTDYLWKLDAANQLYTGMFAGYGGADRDFHTNYSGSTDSGYGGLYATWLNDSGWYADVVAKGQYFRNEFSGADRGDYDSVGVGFSVEFGRQFEFAEGWFAEPSVQFSYLHLMNDNYTTRDGMHVDLTDADVLHIYGGARFGRNIKLTNSGGMLQPYIKAGGLGQISSGNKLTVSGDHWRPNLDGARAVVGAGVVWQLDADSQLHLDYEASFGEKYDKPWGVNFGYRYQF